MFCPSNKIFWLNKEEHIKLYLILILFVLLCSQLKIAFATIKADFTVKASIEEYGLYDPQPKSFILTTILTENGKKPNIIEKIFIKVLPTPNPTPVSTPQPQVLAEQLTKWEQYQQAVDKVLPLFKMEQVKGVVLAQGALESGRGTSNFAVERNNFLGLSAFDWNPDQAQSFESAEECVIEYVRIIKKNFPEAYKSKDNPDRYLELLEHNSLQLKYATDRQYIEKIKKMPEYKKGVK